MYVRMHTFTLCMTVTMNLQGEPFLLASYEVLHGNAGVMFLRSLPLVLHRTRIGEIEQWEINYNPNPSALRSTELWGLQSQDKHLELTLSWARDSFYPSRALEKLWEENVFYLLCLFHLLILMLRPS